MNTDYILYSFE
ncbi:hypothetical protein SAMN04488136_13465 [Vibrio xiamenensis]|uniref:Uncharacterized protein n=1 Tax=Vibrio xiamenensis TaxID=861298 RepID=A0A1G8BYE6_9VIBR|nr:hypothetical protein SAMN04488136_112124 [Vibrio xiamenensis]SDH38043.1 hypothetical protein SAMN04488136_114107 [Vibrio xiamenensis]SDH89430.1 hypothetical protein SAMN04488136_13465 [Vibrio xiamenensis]